MKSECVEYKKSIRPDLVKNHFESNKANFLEVIQNIINANLEDNIKIEMIETKLVTYKEKMRYSIDLFC